ncbi:MAG: hypothetical protein KDK62_02410 [Chlamydiia bacterium]|nr:hypothetical protein [Chlamydiia bacterium]
MNFDFKKAFTRSSRERKKLSPVSEMEKIFSEEYDDLSKRAALSEVQEGSLIRGTLRARRLAQHLFSEEGKLDLSKIESAIEAAKKYPYIYSLRRDEDTIRQLHILNALRHMKTSHGTRNLIDRLSRPEQNPILEKVIRETLDLSEHHSITDLDTRIAAVSAWLTYLRQSVGSCFATAPAILLQMEQPDQMLKDFKELLETGRLKRVVGGVEVIAPMSASWGVGDFRKPILLDSGNSDRFKAIGLSPGIMAALTAVGIIESDLPLKERVEKTIEKVFETLKFLDTGASFFVITPEKLLKTLVLRHFELSDAAYQEWLNRPRDMVYGSLMMTMAHADRGQKGAGQKAAKVMEALAQGRSAFMRLAENAFLKTWEFTLASFAETKGEFSTWNLYVSLGMDPSEPDGIGQALFQETKERLDRANAKVQGYQDEYEVLYSQLKFVEGRAKSAQTEREMKWLQADYQSKLNEFRTFEEMRNKEHYRAKRLANLFSEVIDRYLELFPRYFQEVYDAEVHEVTEGFWDDRPAGFRLLFKHGRASTAQWTRIDSPDTYSQALTSFFSLTESELSHQAEFEGLEQDISALVTRASQQVRTKAFLESALWRMAKKHNRPMIKDPLDHLDQMDKLPWAYTSGGNLNTLISSYFRLDEKPKETSRYVDNEIELIVFLADTMKEIPYETTDRFLEEPYRRMLMHSPTHAFTLMPGRAPFCHTWKDDEFTYTAIRDEFVHPAQRYWEKIVINNFMFDHLIQALIKKVPESFKPAFKRAFLNFPGEMSPPDLADYILDKIDQETTLNAGGRRVVAKETIAEVFFDKLPFIPTKDITPSIFEEIPQFMGFFKEVLSHLSETYISANELIEIILGIYIENNLVTSGEMDLLKMLSDKFRQIGWISPRSVQFADTNWPGYFFSMLVSPASGKLELWRVDRLGLKGVPMLDWKPWLDGSRKKPSWGVLSNPYQYTM